MSIVRNYFNFEPGVAAAASEAFENQSERVSFQAEEWDIEWVEMMHEMLADSTLQAIVDVEKEDDSLSDRLVNLSVAGVSEISLVGRSASVVSEAMSQCREINQRERLGLRINCDCSHIR